MRKNYKIIFVILFFIILLFLFSPKSNADVTLVTVKYKGQELTPNGGPYRISKENVLFNVHEESDGWGYYYLNRSWVEYPDGSKKEEIDKQRATNTITVRDYGYLYKFDKTGPATLRVQVWKKATDNGIVGPDDELQYDVSIPVVIVEGTDQGEVRPPVVFTDVLDSIENYVPGDMPDDDAGEVEDKVSKILSVITTFGMIITVLVPAILGIKYMLGSVEEKAEYKKELVPYFIGAMLLFGICTIIKITQQFGENINSQI